jgi:hypothetical protein
LRISIAAALVAALAVVGVVLIGGSSGGKGRHDPDGGRDRGERFEVKDPDKDARPGMITPAREAYINRAYPRRYIPASAVRSATRKTRALPTKLARSQFKHTVRDAAIRATVGADWQLLGPTTPFAPGATTESLKDSITSGRVTALAVDPNCGSPGHGCRLWMAAAGGGIWRTDDGLAATPAWTPVDNGLPTNAFGSLIVDPND